MSSKRHIEVKWPDLIEACHSYKGELIVTVYKGTKTWRFICAPRDAVCIAGALKDFRNQFRERLNQIDAVVVD